MNYFTILLVATQGLRDRARRVGNFSRALKTALEEQRSKCGPGCQDTILSKVETFFEQSKLNRNYRSTVEAMEYLQYTLYAKADEKGGRFKEWTDEDRVMVDEVLARLREKKPFCALEGDARRLLGSVRGHLTKGQAGEEAISELADHIRSVEQKAKRERRMGRLILSLTVLGIGVSVAAIVVSLPDQGADSTAVVPDRLRAEAEDSLVVPNR